MIGEISDGLQRDVDQDAKSLLARIEGCREPIDLGFGDMTFAADESVHKRRQRGKL